MAVIVIVRTISCKRRLELKKRRHLGKKQTLVCMWCACMWCACVRVCVCVCAHNLTIYLLHISEEKSKWDTIQRRSNLTDSLGGRRSLKVVLILAYTLICRSYTWTHTLTHIAHTDCPNSLEFTDVLPKPSNLTWRPPSFISSRGLIKWILFYNSLLV